MNRSFHPMAFVSIYLFYNWMEILQFRMVDMRGIYCAERGRNKKQEAELIDEQEKLTMTDHSLPRRHMHGSMKRGRNTSKDKSKRYRPSNNKPNAQSRDWQLTIVIATIQCSELEPGDRQYIFCTSANSASKSTLRSFSSPSPRSKTQP